MSLQRRDVLALLATGAVAGLAGCSSSCPDSDDPDPGASVRRPSSPTGFDSLPAGDWPGPRRDPGNTGYAPSGRVPTDDVTVRWQTDLPTPPVADAFVDASSPTVADGTVFVTTGAGVTALDLRDGTTAWSTEISPALVSPTHGFDREVAPPVVAGDTVYAATDSGVVALAAADGTERWRAATDGPVGIPAVADGTVVVDTDAEATALDAADGTERWTVATGDGVSFPAVGDGAVVLQVQGLENERTLATAAIDLADGTERWRTGTVAEFFPVIADGSVYLGSYEGLFCLALGDGSRRWRLDRGSGRSLSSPVVTPDALYLAERPGEAGDAAFAFDRTDGKPTPRWCSSVGDATVPCATDDHALVLEGSAGIDEVAPSLVAFTAGFGDALWGLGGRDRVLPPAILDGAVVTVAHDGRVLALGGA